MSSSQPRAKIEQTLSRRHPLQRLESPSKGFSGALHNDAFGWHFQFLTIIGLLLTTLTFFFGLLADLTSTTSTTASPTSTTASDSPPSTTTLSTRLFTAKNYIALIATPLEITISLLYWGIRTIDGNLLVRTDLPLPPFFWDIGFHLVPAVVLSLDAILLSPPWPTSPMNEQAPTITLVLSTLVAFAYWLWIELCYTQNGYYPYPLFEMLSTNQRIGLFVVSGVIMWVVGGLSRAVYAKLNGYESVEELDKVKRSKAMGANGKWE
ncbi:hypothetical protein BDW02DRAFT_488695 [Decorospora gaudefroyi]|uniref:FAR-17a/AIG1-like protein n=1 Tax=Decorospora gaudefroyi TaxID=184978 RepID=A0A6A5KN87_9PLEO|nr:hypothetical protein BDW02DRAFT_488695 [Decorospora gaudefroyi]